MQNLIDGLIVEKVEQHRSRISLLKNTLNQLKQNFETINKTSSQKLRLIPNPKASLSAIENIISYLDIYLGGIDLYGTHDKILESLAFLEENSDVAIDLTLQVQNLMEQRISGITPSELLESHPNSQVEYAGMDKIYIAIDALSSELVSILMEKKMKYYKPISIFGRGNYHVRKITSLISIPYHDIFRIRYWLILSHEMSHLYIWDKIELEGSDLTYFFDDAVASLRAVFLKNFSHEERIQYWNYFDIKLGFQIEELTCDLIATYICGPCYAFSIGTYLPLTYGEEFLQDMEIPLNVSPRIRMSTHPNFETRIHSSVQMLQEMEVLNEDTFLIFSSGFNRFKKYNNELLNSESNKLISDYIGFGQKYAILLFDYLQNDLKIKGYDKKRNQSIVDTLNGKNTDTSDFTPIMLLNLAWYKRIKKYKHDYGGLVSEYFEKKRTELKFYEIAIAEMNNYYFKYVFNPAFPTLNHK